MEDSIRRAEKLVYATNSALAQMKFNLTFEDYEKESRASKVLDRGTKNLFLDEEMQKYEEEFKSEANEMLSKMDKMLDPNQYFLSRKPSSQAFKVRERMKEINNKFQDRSQEQTNSRETEQSRLKLLSLINQEEIEIPHKPYVKHISSSNNSEAYRNTSSTITTAGAQNIRKNPIRNLRKTDSLPTIIGNYLHKMNPKKELKNKLLETQEIVDRGFETARHLKQKVDSLTNFEKKIEKTPSTVKTCFSENLNTTKSFDSTHKSESNEAIKLTKIHKCKKHQQKEKKKEEYFEEKKKKSEEIIKDYEEKAIIEKNSLISIKRVEEKKLKYFKFNFQRLPSLHIKGGLQVQRIHNLEILPENLEVETNYNNIGIKIVSHEEMEREKINKIIENIETENCFCPKKTYTNHIKCFNCGKLNKVEENVVDPTEIDNLLMKCSFNVFDPRIDEFVEKYKQKKTVKHVTERKTLDENIKEPDIIEKTNENTFFEKETKEKSTQKDVETERTLKIQELSEEVTQAYKEKASQLEDEYEEFESILRGLFRKIDKSRVIFDKFDSCHIPSSSENKEKNVAKRYQKFTKTKPVVICLADSADQKKDVEEPTAAEKDSLKLHKQYNKKHICRKKKKEKSLNKKDVKHDFKDVIPDNSYKNTILKKFNLENNIIKDRKKEETELEIEPTVSPVVSVAPQISEINETNEKNILDIEANSFDNQFEFSEISCTESIMGEKFDSTFSTENEYMKTENDYESDFEGESIKNEEIKDLEDDKIEEENEDLVKCTKKLSTILEVDSEAEKKISEIEFTNSSKEKSVKIALEEALEQLPICSDKKSSQNITNNLNQKPEKDLASTLGSIKTGDIFETRSEKEDFSKRSLSPKASSESIRVREKCENLEKNKKSDCQNVSQNLSDKPLNPSPTKNNSSSTMVTALKEVLSALQDQFHKTQSLAEKLTENVNSSRKEAKPAEIESTKNETEILPFFSPVVRDLNLSNKALLVNLQNNRKNLDNAGNEPSESLFLHSTDQENQNYQFLRHPKFQITETPDNNLSRKNISRSPSIKNIELDNLNSVSTIKMKDRRQSESSSNSEMSFVKLALSSSRKETSSKLDSAKSGVVEKGKFFSSLSLEVDNENISYSEGEIINPDILESDRSSTRSIGEVISERISEASFSE